MTPTFKSTNDLWREHVFSILTQYWPEKTVQYVKALPISNCSIPEREILPPKLNQVALPAWCEDVGVEKHLLVPQWAYQHAQGKWDFIDWIAVIFWYTENLAERAYEKMCGPIHSYSIRLKGWNSALWNHAWVNRIALLLRKWAAMIKGSDEKSLFGSLPKAEIKLTHDVDAVSKTFPIRIKQTAFHLFNTARFLIRGKPLLSIKSFKKCLQFSMSNDNYWCFDEINKVEEQHGVKSTYNFFSLNPARKRNCKDYLMDPSYNVQGKDLQNQIRTLYNNGWSIGLHPSFDSWQNAEYFKEEKDNLESSLGHSIYTCRQHWLRFSFQDTWKMQQSCGIREDTTLGFNDRPGFRNASALTKAVWDFNQDKATNLVSIPMILMDSHLFDYRPMDDNIKLNEIKMWLNEVKFVGGSASVVWHQRVFSNDYKWGKIYSDLMQEIT